MGHGIDGAARSCAGSALIGCDTNVITLRPVDGSGPTTASVRSSGDHAIDQVVAAIRCDLAGREVDQHQRVGRRVQPAARAGRDVGEHPAVLADRHRPARIAGRRQPLHGAAGCRHSFQLHRTGIMRDPHEVHPAPVACEQRVDVTRIVRQPPQPLAGVRGEDGDPRRRGDPSISPRTSPGTRRSGPLVPLWPEPPPWPEPPQPRRRARSPWPRSGRSGARPARSSARRPPGCASRTGSAPAAARSRGRRG